MSDTTLPTKKYGFDWLSLFLIAWFLAGWVGLFFEPFSVSYYSNGEKEYFIVVPFIAVVIAIDTFAQKQNGVYQGGLLVSITFLILGFLSPLNLIIRVFHWLGWA